MKVYDSNAVAVIFGGFSIKSGRGEDGGAFVKLTPVEPERFKAKPGTDGEVTRSRTNNRLWDIELTLMQTSDGNDVLQALHSTDWNSPNGLGIVPMTVKDTIGRSLHQFGKAWIVGPPEAEFAAEAGTRVWKIKAEESVINTGGN